MLMTFTLFLKSNFKIYIYLEDDTLIKADYIEFEDLQNYFWWRLYSY